MDITTTQTQPFPLNSGTTTITEFDDNDPAKAFLKEFDTSKLTDKPKLKSTTKPKQSGFISTEKLSSQPLDEKKSTTEYTAPIFGDDYDEPLSTNIAHSTNTRSTNDESNTNDSLPMKNQTEKRLFELQLRMNKARQEAKLAMQEEAKILDEFGQPIIPPVSDNNSQNKKREKQDEINTDNKEKSEQETMDPDRYYRLHQTIETLDKREKARKRKSQSNKDFDSTCLNTSAYIYILEITHPHTHTHTSFCYIRVTRKECPITTNFSSSSSSSSLACTHSFWR
jgi:hypothetical protein